MTLKRIKNMPVSSVQEYIKIGLPGTGKSFVNLVTFSWWHTGTNNPLTTQQTNSYIWFT